MEGVRIEPAADAAGVAAVEALFDGPGSTGTPAPAASAASTAPVGAPPEAVSVTKQLLGETAATGHEQAFAALWDAKSPSR